jgi:hypothetical protein
MKSINKVGVALTASILLACVSATSVSATSFSPAATAFSMRSSSWLWSWSGGGTTDCMSVIRGTTPVAGVATLPIDLSFTGCTAFGLSATVTVPAACKPSGASALRLTVSYRSATDIVGTVTIPSGCTITINVPAISCTLAVSGAQVIGNGTSGAGGIGWRNGTASPAVFSSMVFSNATTPTMVSSGGGFGCPSAGAHTGVAGSTFVATAPTPAPGITVGP